MGDFMKKIEKNKIISGNEESTHKSRCTECPVYNECMGTWLDYFAGKKE
jgi:hypothetical protein